jgi:hypothetical protein
LRSSGDGAVLVISIGVDHAEDFEDGVGEVGVPATGAEAHLAECFPVREACFFEGLAGGDETVEGLLVELGKECVPEFLDPLGVAGFDGLLHFGEGSAIVDCCFPGVGNLAEELRQFI